MKTRNKLIILIFVSFFSIFHNSAAKGEDLIPDLKGKWNGTAFLYADSKGFTSHINKRLSLDVIKQSGLDFSGTIEIKEKNIIRKLVFSGFADKKKRYLCFIAQGGEINLGYLITKNVMKVHFRSIGHMPEITIYRLIKEKRPQNENLSKDKPMESIRHDLPAHTVSGWLPEGK